METGKEEGRDGSALNPQGIAGERNHLLVGATVITSPSSMVGCILCPVARNRTQEPRRSSSAVRSGKMAGVADEAAALPDACGKRGDLDSGTPHEGEHMLVRREAEFVAGT